MGELILRGGLLPLVCDDFDTSEYVVCCRKTPNVESKKSSKSTFGNFALEDEVVVAKEMKDASPVMKRYKSKRTGQMVYFCKTKSNMIECHLSVRTLPDSNAGEPHCIEHLALEGCKKLNYPVQTICAANGMQFINAMTQPQQTTFMYAACSQKGLLNALPYLMSYVKQPTLDARSFTTEIYHVNGKNEEGGVLYNEISDISQGESGKLIERLAKTLLKDTCFNLSHVGLVPAIRELTLSQLKAYHKKYYTWNNMAVILTGNVDEKSVLQAITKIENEMPDTPHTIKRSVPHPVTKRTVEKVEVPGKPGDANSMIVLFSSKDNEPQIESKTRGLGSALDILAATLFGGTPSTVVGGLMMDNKASWGQPVSETLGRIYRGCVLGGVENMDSTLDAGVELLKNCKEKLTLENIHSIIKLTRQGIQLSAENGLEAGAAVLGKVFATNPEGSLAAISTEEFDRLLRYPLSFWQGLADKYFVNAPAFVAMLIPTEMKSDIPPLTKSVSKADVDMYNRSVEYSGRVMSKTLRASLPRLGHGDIKVPTVATFSNMENHTIRKKPVSFYRTPTNPEEKRLQDTLKKCPISMTVHNVDSQFIKVESFTRLPTTTEYSKNKELYHLAFELMSLVERDCPRQYGGKVVKADAFAMETLKHVMEHSFSPQATLSSPMLARSMVQCAPDKIGEAMRIAASRRNVDLSDETLETMLTDLHNSIASSTHTHAVETDAVSKFSLPSGDERRLLTVGYLTHLVEKHRSNLAGIRDALKTIIEASFDPKSTCVFVTGAGKDITPETLKTIVEEGGYDKGAKPRNLKDILRPINVSKESGNGSMIHVRSTQDTLPNAHFMTPIDSSSARMPALHLFDAYMSGFYEGVSRRIRGAGTCYSVPFAMNLSNGICTLSCVMASDVGKCMEYVISSLETFNKDGITDEEFDVLKQKILIQLLDRADSEQLLANSTTSDLMKFRERRPMATELIQKLPDVDKEQFMHIAREVTGNIINTVKQKRGYTVIAHGKKETVADSMKACGFKYDDASYKDAEQTQAWLASYNA